jgi:hypothetical protein
MRVELAQRMADLKDASNQPFFNKKYIIKNILKINEADLV